MRKYSAEDIGFINAFEKMTKAQVVDYINDEDSLYFVVKTGNFGAIIGRGGENIHELSNKFGKKLKVFKYSKDLKEFVKNLIMRPVESIEVVESDKGKYLKIKASNKDKAMIIGCEGKNLNIIRELIKKQFKVKEIHIV